MLAQRDGLAKATVAAICVELTAPNLISDLGHALAAYEDVGESVAILARAGNKLFHMHFNDNYRLWDDDMIVGSVHTIEYLELLHWLDRVDYDGYLSLDQYPHREQPEEAITESVLWLQTIRTIVERMGHNRIAEVIQTGNAALAQRLIRQAMMNEA